MINCACIFTIYRVYAANEPDLCLNPFLGFFLKLWKVFTNVVLLGLEIDRRVEQIEDQETPNIVNQVIRGSTAVRYVLASILNDDTENRFHDFNHVNILDFMSPYGRRNGSGGLYADVRWYVGALLALGSELNEVVETLVDLEPNDRYDEDVRYMFDYEYDDFHHDILYPEEYDDEGNLLKDEPIIYEDGEGNLHRVVEKRCTCEFFNDDAVFEQRDEYDEEEGEPLGNENKEIRMPTAVRSNEEDIEFDEMGRDWRDVPREGNIFFNAKAQLTPAHCFDWQTLISTFDDMTAKPVSHDVSQKAINTIAMAVKNEFEERLIRNDDEIITMPDAVTPDKIYEQWSCELVFEKMLALNPEACSCMLDEMLMANGYRRVLIWFITHMDLSFNLIHYIFELITGLRGESKERKQKFIFSRQGPLVLSDIEKSMLLHEFLNNCLIYLSKNYEVFINSNPNLLEQQHGNVSDFEKCVKIVKLICLMIVKLLEKDMIDIDEYKVELTSLLINWIGVIPEAKVLFFKINNHASEEEILDNMEFFKENNELTAGRPRAQLDSLMTPKQSSQAPLFTLQRTDKRHKKFNKGLKTSLSNVIKKLDSGTLLFRPFFELIDQESGVTQALGKSKPKPNGGDNDDGEIEAPITVSDNDNQYGYIRGHLKPLRHDEELEHERFEESITNDY